MQSTRIVMAQMNPKVGDINANIQSIIEQAHTAKRLFQADLVVFPELCITGYPPEDLLLRHGLYPQVQAALDTLCEAVTDIALVIGYPMIDDLGERFNMAGWIGDGQLQASYQKQHLPNYGVFDEKRHFSAGKTATVMTLNGITFGLTICADIWAPMPAALAVEAGAQVILTLNASPFHQEKIDQRIDALSQRATTHQVPIVYVNQVGGQDALVFDGASFVLNSQGQRVIQATSFTTSLTPLDLVVNEQGKVQVAQQDVHPEPATDVAMIYEALVLGVRDYVNKNDFPGVIIGLSGGIDSALTLAIAVDALGAERVEAVMMPYTYTAQLSVTAAQQQAKRLGVRYNEITIEPIVSAFEHSLAERFSGYEQDTTEENLQARTRGMLLMAISNKTGALVLPTGNKSEMAVGYATLYGDMAGGFAPLKDVPKTLVYELATHRNELAMQQALSNDATIQKQKSAWLDEHVHVIPQIVIDRPPSAELRPDQQDQDSLPSYDLLDAIVQAYVEEDKTTTEMIESGLNADAVHQVVRLINRNEYKRRQSAPGIKITHRNFGLDRRYPITHGYRD